MLSGLRSLRTPPDDSETDKKRSDKEQELANEYFAEMQKDESFNDFQTLQGGLVKLFNADFFHSCHCLNREYKQSHPQNFTRLNESKTIDGLTSAFLDILYLPFGTNKVNSCHSSYLVLKKLAKKTRSNHPNRYLFRGTSPRPYCDGFSNHAYTFAAYLAEYNKTAAAHLLLNDKEIQSILQLFYFSYIKRKYHSFGEIDAAFLFASQDFSFPPLNIAYSPQEAQLVSSSVSDTKNSQLKETISQVIQEYIASLSCINFYGHQRAIELLIDIYSEPQNCQTIINQFIKTGKTESDQRWYSIFFSFFSSSGYGPNSLRGMITNMQIDSRKYP